MVLVAAKNPESSLSTTVTFAAYYWAGSVYAYQATFFAWCNDAMRIDAPMFRGIVFAGMNMGASSVSWFNRGM
ncbi:unnamed protein product, partial [Clonostachys solani]